MQYTDTEAALIGGLISTYFFQPAVSASLKDAYKATNPGKTSRPEKNPLDAKTTYHIGNRSFVVEPVFKEESPDTLGSVLLRLMKSESEKL